jgi:hypothetical protein
MQTIAQPQLSRDEWHAVAIALNDAARAPLAAGRGLLGRLYTALTGNAPLRPLADPRLEAIRAFVFQTRRRHALAEEQVPALLEHGFNCRQVKALALLSA